CPPLPRTPRPPKPSRFPRPSKPIKLPRLPKLPKTHRPPKPAQDHEHGPRRPKQPPTPALSFARPSLSRTLTRFASSDKLLSGARILPQSSKTAARQRPCWRLIKKAAKEAAGRLISCPAATYDSHSMPARRNGILKT